MPDRSCPRRSLRSIACLVLGAASLMAGGCRYADQLSDGPTYPSREQARTLDIQVRRDETLITLTNTSAADIPACRMWVNRWWSREIDALPVGATTTLSLTTFTDTYGDPFHAGGFFATEPPDKLVQAQFEYGGEIVGLTVIGE